METMKQKRQRHEAAAKAMGAKQFDFVPMQDGVDYGCQADLGSGMEPFYLPDNVEFVRKYFEDGCACIAHGKIERAPTESAQEACDRYMVQCECSRHPGWGAHPPRR